MRTHLDGIQLKAALDILPPGYAIVPEHPTPGMLEQAAFNLSAEHGTEVVKQLEKFARDCYGEFLAAGRVR